MCSVKRLVIDLETSPNVVLDFDVYDSKPRGHKAIIEPTRILCFAYKWVGERGVQVVSEWDECGHDGMIRKAHELLSEADAVVHFNGTSFDVKHFNREFIEAGLTPPAPYEQIDLYLAVKRRTRFPSSSLDYVTKALALRAKGDPGGIETWKKVREGDAKAQERMARYCARDVVITESLYHRLLPWIDGHPSAVLDGRAECPKCEGPIEWRGEYRSKTRRYRRFVCKHCGSWGKTVKSSGGAALVGVS